MARHCDARLDGIQAKRSAARFATSDIRGESTRKDLATCDATRMVGRVIARIGELAGLTDEQVGHSLRYSGGSEVSRWKSGAAVPEFLARVIANPAIRSAFIEGLAELPDDSVTLERVVRIQRKERIA